MKRAPSLLPSGEIVSVKPALLNVKAAALYCACSAGLLNSLRSADAKTLRSGGPLTGPVWCRVAFGIRYKPCDLDAWIARTSVVCGVMESRRRAAPTVEGTEAQP